MSAITFGTPPSLPVEECAVMQRPGDQQFVPGGDFEYESFFKGLVVKKSTALTVNHENGAVYRRDADKVGRGTYGDVYRYTLVEDQTPLAVRNAVPYCFALKSMHNSYEAEVLRLLERRGINIQFAAIKKKGFSKARCFVAMPLYDGTLQSYARTVNNKGVTASAVINIMITSLTMVAKLWAVGLSYMDFKATNVLYVACGRGADVPLSLILGDIGSIMEVASNTKALATFPYPLGFDHEGRNLDADSIRVAQSMEGMMWAIAITGLNLLRFDPMSASYERIVNGVEDARARGVQNKRDIDLHIYKECIDAMLGWVDKLGEPAVVRCASGCMHRGKEGPLSHSMRARRANLKDAISTLVGRGDGSYAIPVGSDPQHAVDDIVKHLQSCEDTIDRVP